MGIVVGVRVGAVMPNTPKELSVTVTWRMF